jgi:tripartite-type tricarboxylate transporter receptor subunit TctC
LWSPPFPTRFGPARSPLIEVSLSGGKINLIDGPAQPDVDFEPIGVVIEVPIVLVARKNFPASDLKEFMATSEQMPRS